jgi:mannose-6-phosphate isomerase
MPTLDGPLQLSNILKPKIWGRKDLAPLFGASRGREPRGPHIPSAEPEELIGEVWITDDASQFLNGPLSGLTLGEAGEKYGDVLHGKSWQGRRFPILAKFIFTSDWLSIQVHPDDDYARVHDPGNVGKCEMWYTVRSDPGAKLLLGLKPRITKEELKEALERGTTRELLQDFRPKDEEALFVPPGTIHALGPGLVLFEVEENSDLTYRLDDFGRLGLDGKPRPLHWSKGLDVILGDAPFRRELPRVVVREPFGSRRYVLACRYFALEELRLRKAAHFESSPRRVETLFVLEGDGRVENRAGWLGYRTGNTWLIPPAACSYRFVPRQMTRLLKFYVPNPDVDFRRPLARRRVPALKVSRIVFD